MTNDAQRQRALEDTCDRAIKKTLAYSGIFGYPLSYNQLANLLICEKEITQDIFNKSLKRLIKKKYIRTNNRKFYTPNIKPLSWTQRYQNSMDLLESNKVALGLLYMIPWIKLLAISGSVAAFNADKNDDIDVFIIAQKNRLWLTRGFVAVILKILGKYAVGSENKRKFCCNLLISENNMLWPLARQNVFVAREVVGMQPIINRDNSYFRFLLANRWVFKYLANFHIDLNLNSPQKKKSSWSGLVDAVEQLAMDAQLKYMKGKKTNEVTNKTIIHFNKHDHMQNIMDTYTHLIKST